MCAATLARRTANGATHARALADGELLRRRVDAVTQDLVERISAVDILRAVTPELGGKGGGGRADMAQGGGASAENAQAGFAAAKALIEGA